MTQKGFFIDVSRCTGCRTCSVACADAKNTPLGLNLRRVLEVEGGDWIPNGDGTWRQSVFAYYLSVACHECAHPACVKVCPTGAHLKREEDGLVVIDRDKCIGCGACASACPYEVPQLDTKAHKMLKCDGCLDRTSQGGQPVCVESCPERAIEFGDIDELRRRHGTLADLAPLPSSAQTQPSLVIKPSKAASRLSGQHAQAHRF
jgi:anaerobic dimethyl sulfoxide reductase subunit B (iron-sulfur subunit)